VRPYRQHLLCSWLRRVTVLPISYDLMPLADASCFSLEGFLPYFPNEFGTK